MPDSRVRTRTNQEWLQELQATGELQNAAIEDLRAILFRAALFSFQRNRGDLARFDPEGIRQLAEDCAQDALMAVLESLPKFRGESKFTTWIYKFAINISLTAARRERWRGVPLEALADQQGENEWFFVDKSQPALDDLAARGEVETAIREMIRTELTERQRLVLKLIVFDEVPMDVVVERLETNRNAVYKLLHDARRKLKVGLEAHGIGAVETIDLFAPNG
jgi:RNA polymerase sigma-70 factor (ECF subfamily)